MDHAKKMKERIFISDVLDSLLAPGDFKDAFAWVPEWDVPFRNAERAAHNDDTLGYREGFIPVKPNPKYAKQGIAVPLKEFTNEEVRKSIQNEIPNFTVFVCKGRFAEGTVGS
jgi:hypothetical protein